MDTLNAAGNPIALCWQHRPAQACPHPDSCRSNGCSAVERELFPDNVLVPRRLLGEVSNALSNGIECARFVKDNAVVKRLLDVQQQVENQLNQG